MNKQVKARPPWLMVMFEDWWTHQDWTSGAFAWIPMLAIWLALIPISLLWWLIDYSTKKIMKEAK